MSLNGSGVFNVNSAGQPVVADTTISPSVFNAFTADVATALSTAIFKDGQQTVTANIPFGGFKITGLGAGTARTDGASLANLQDATGVYVATVGGTADVITLTPSPAITAYAAGQTFRFIASGANTTAVTVAISGLVAKAVTKHGAAALVSGDIASGELLTMTYDGTRFQIERRSQIRPVQFTRDLTTATGTQNVAHGGTGLPKAAILFATVSGSTIASWGMDSVGIALSIYLTATDANIRATASASISLQTVNGVDFQTASISAVDATNITISWTKTGSPTGTGTIYGLIWF